MLQLRVFFYGEKAIDGDITRDQAMEIGLDSRRGDDSMVNVLLGRVLWGQRLNVENTLDGIIVESKY